MAGSVVKLVCLLAVWLVAHRQDGLKLTNFDTHEGDNEKTVGRSACHRHIAATPRAESSGYQVKEMLDLTEPWRNFGELSCLDVRCAF